MLKIPTYETKAELFDFLVKNKETLINQKKSQIKEAESFSFAIKSIKKGDTDKSNDAIDNIDELSKINVIVAINTTNIMDSHDDVHLPNLWKKSISENKRIMHIQEHKRNEFAKIISEGEDLKVYTKYFTWKELGFDFEGRTQALIFDSIVRKERNEFMFNQYANGFVKNHSVGMRYVKLLLAVNDESYPAEFDAWNKYYKEIVNKELADEKGYFYVVKEAKIIEGSAVPVGSNFVTPTIENNKEANKEISEIDLLKSISNSIEPTKEAVNDNTFDSLEFLKTIKNSL